MLQNLDKMLNSLKYSFIVAVIFFYKGHQSNWTGVPEETLQPAESHWQT